MKKSTIILFILIFNLQFSFSQNKSILICGFLAELGMTKVEFMSHMSDYYKVQSIDGLTQDHEFYMIYERQNEIGMVEFNEESKLVRVNKDWGNYSIIEGKDFYECLFSILEKYKTELKTCQILAQDDGFLLSIILSINNLSSEDV